jgi:hypothetical protein
MGVAVGACFLLSRVRCGDDSGRIGVWGLAPLEMGKKNRASLGFDVARAIESLRAAAVARGVFPAGDPRAAWPHMVAEEHLHPMGPDRRCRQNPCSLAGLCLALYELLQHEGELAVMKDALAAVRKGKEVASHLDSAIRRLGEVEELVKTTKIPERAKEAATLASRISTLRTEVDRFSQGLKPEAWSPQLQQPSTRKGADLLLRAVWQHLDWGGFTYEEAFELVPTLAKVSNPKDTVRDRVKDADARSLFPREEHPDLFEPPRVEKRRRRRSST